MMKFFASVSVAIERFASLHVPRWSRQKVAACAVSVALAWSFVVVPARRGGQLVDGCDFGELERYWKNWNLGHVPTSSEVVRFDNLSTANLNTVNNVCARRSEL